MQIHVLLCSTKAASLGLNLTMASRVILLDSWWNGATEDQAIDRCHRLGQTREVHVVKIAMKLSESEDTVEQRIINMQVCGSSLITIQSSILVAIRLPCLCRPQHRQLAARSASISSHKLVQLQFEGMEDDPTQQEKMG